MMMPRPEVFDSLPVRATAQRYGDRSVRGVSHLTFMVRDLERMSTFMCEGLGASEVYDSKDRNFSLSREKFFVLGGVWIAAMQGDPPSTRSYQHVAFRVDQDDLAGYRKRLVAIGAEVLPPRPRVDGEGLSLYVYVRLNHSILPGRRGKTCFSIKPLILNRF